MPSAVPLLVSVCEDDQIAPARPAVRVAQTAPHGELHRYPSNSSMLFTGAGFEQIVSDQNGFLRRAADHDLSDTPVSAKEPLPYWYAGDPWAYIRQQGHSLPGDDQGRRSVRHLVASVMAATVSPKTRWAAKARIWVEAG